MVIFRLFNKIFTCLAICAIQYSRAKQNKSIISNCSLKSRLGFVHVSTNPDMKVTLRKPVDSGTAEII